MKMLCIYADYKSDESYTPSKISVRVGNNFHNLQEIRVSLCFCGSDRHSCWMLKPSNCFIFVSAAAGDGGAQRLDSHLSTKSGKNIQWCKTYLFFLPVLNIKTCFKGLNG